MVFNTLFFIRLNNFKNSTLFLNLSETSCEISYYILCLQVTQSRK
jgi:hypothetical protein